MFRRLFLISIISLLFTSSIIGTQPEPVVLLGSIEVTSRPWSDTSIHVIGSNTLQNKANNGLVDVLQLVPGITMSVSGGRNEANFSMRGFDVKHAPVFVDGIQVTAPYDGYTDVGRHLLWGLASVEVVRGYVPLSLGPGTLAGAINCVSARPEKEYQARMESGLRLDNDSTRSLWWTGANASGKRDAWHFKTDFFTEERDFVPVPGDFTPTATEDGGKRDNSFSGNSLVALELGWTPDQESEFILRVSIQRGDKGIPVYAGSNTSLNKPRYWQMPEWDKDSISMIGRTAITDSILVKTRFWYDSFDNTVKSYDNNAYLAMTKPSSFASIYNDKNFGAACEMAIDLSSNWVLQPFLLYRHDQHQGHNVGEPEVTQEDDTVSIGVEQSYSISRDLVFRAGIAWSQANPGTVEDLVKSGTNYSILPFATSPRVAWDLQAGLWWKAGETATLHTSVAKRTRFPTLKDRYSYKLGKAWANPGLMPEDSVQVEAGASMHLAPWLSFNGTIFVSETEKYIQVVPVTIGTETRLQSCNVGRVRIPGLELAIEGKISSVLNWNLTASWINPDNLDSTADIPDIPKVQCSAIVGVQALDNLSFDLEWQYSGSRTDMNDQSVTLDGYHLAGLATHWTISKLARLSLGVANIFDTLSYASEGYPLAGREIWVKADFTY
ncbi:MAG TPA: TonB-dependent receptor [Spirochaetota bacterium]|nr:TonB-dependent receptor [Spirochaetota bacterium]